MSLSTVRCPVPPHQRPERFVRLRSATLAAGIGLAVALAPFASVPHAYAQDAVPGTTAAVQLPSLAPLVKKVMPAVVNISVTMKAGATGDDEQSDDQDQGQGQDQGQDQDQDQDQMGPGQNAPGFPPSPFDQFLRRFFDQQQGRNGGGVPQPQVQRMALGSGFIIDPSGYIVTNNHVVENAGKVSVIFQDGSKHPAKIVGRDAKTDLALIKIDAPQPLPYVQWGDSNATQVGDWVLAVGNPFGLGGTVNSGIISARGRDIHSGPYDDFLQIDASINRGNSGGPTFNLQGQVIGINTAIYSPNGGSVGIGFAIPSSLAKPVIDQIREHGKVERGWLGVQIQQVTPEIAKSLNLPKDAGALVADVTKDGPAAKAGFKQGDVILSFNGHDISKVRDLPIVVAETPVGKQADVHVWRSGKDMELEPTIGPMPDNPQMVAQNDNGGGQDQDEHASSMGLRLAPLTAERHRLLHVPAGVKGVVVESIADNSPLAEFGLAPGDVIQEIDQQPVTTPKQVVDKLNAVKNQKGGNKNLLLLLNRHGVNQFVALSFSGNGNG